MPDLSAKARGILDALKLGTVVGVTDTTVVDARPCGHVDPQWWCRDCLPDDAGRTPIAYVKHDADECGNPYCTQYDLDPDEP